jgi:hypothetical protein
VHIALATNVGLDPADDATVIVHGLLGSPSGQDRYMSSVYACVYIIVHGVLGLLGSPSGQVRSPHTPALPLEH